MSRDATRPDGSSQDEPEPSSLSALLSPFSYQRRTGADAGPELTIAPDDAVSQARIEPETGAIVLPRLVWPENEPWRAPLPVVEPDFLKEVDAEVARAASANGHTAPPAPVPPAPVPPAPEARAPAAPAAPRPAAPRPEAAPAPIITRGPVPPAPVPPAPVPPAPVPPAPVPPAPVPPAPVTVTPVPVVPAAAAPAAPSVDLPEVPADRTPLPTRRPGLTQAPPPPPEPVAPAAPPRPQSPFAARVAEALSASERAAALPAEDTVERPALPQRPSPAEAPVAPPVPPAPTPPATQATVPFSLAPDADDAPPLPQRPTGSSVPPALAGKPPASLFTPGPKVAEPSPAVEDGPPVPSPFVPPPFVPPPAAEPARRPVFEPPTPVAQSRPTIGEPQVPPPVIVTPAPGSTPPVAPPPLADDRPDDVPPPVFPWQPARTGDQQPTALLQPNRPTSLLPPGPVRSGPPPAGNGLPTLVGEARPGPRFEMPPMNGGPGGYEPPGPLDGIPFDGLPFDGPEPGEEHRSRVRRRLAVGAGIALALVVGYGGVAWALSTRVPPDTTIAGVAVGGLNHGAAAQKLRDTLGGRTGPVAVTVAGSPAQIDPVQAGLTFDPDATIGHNFGFTLDPVNLWHRFVGGLQIAPAAGTDRGKLTAAMTELAAQTRVDPKNATVDFTAGRATLREPVPGRSLDVIAAVDKVDKQWLATTGPIELPVTEQQPMTSREEAQEALDRIAAPALSGPLVVTLGDRRVSLAPEQFSDALSMQANEVGALSLAVNGGRLRQTVLDEEPGLEHDAKDARFVVEGGRPKLVPSVDGVTIAPDELATAAQRALTGTDRTAALNPAPKPAAFTTAMAQALGIKEKTSSWSTPLSGSAGRITNLRVATRTLNGMIVKPGETFSLNGALGERTAEKGYKEAIIISEGAYEKGLGGGVSNVATLTFNNVFFSGLQDVTHKPHSFYISHYPVGREATVHWNDVDLKWKNDSPYGVLITAGVDSSKVHMEFWSTKVWDIKAVTGPRTNFRAPKVIFSTKPLCVPQNPSPGFDINVTRVFSKDGQEVKRQVFRTSYIAQDDITCGEKPPTTTTSPAVTPGDDD